MNLFNTKFTLLSSVFLMVASFVFGQTDYAVTLKGDTLRGRIRIITYDRLDRMQVVADNKKKQYTALEVRTLQIGGVTYHTVSYDNRFTYMKLVKGGFLSLYAFRMPSQSSYDGQYLLKRNGSGVEIPNLTFKKSLSEFLSECPEVKERIKSGDWGRKDVDKIIDRYNGCLQFIEERKIVEPAVAPVTEAESEKMIAINALITKVEANTTLENKTDVVDLLKDLRSKIARNDILPNYILKDLKNQLGAHPDFVADVEKLLSMLKKERK